MVAIEVTVNLRHVPLDNYTEVTVKSLNRFLTLIAHTDLVR